MPGGVFVIAQVRYNKILTRLRGSLTGHFSSLGVSLCSILFWELQDNEVVKMCNFVPKASESCLNFNLSNVDYHF